MAHFTGEAGAAIVFLVGYLVLFSSMLAGFLRGQLKWKSRYFLLFFYITIRVVSGAMGVAFGTIGMSNFRVFLAYLILNAEGYFALVLCAFRFLVSWHEHHLPSQESWLEPRREHGVKHKELKLLFLGPFAYLLDPKDFMLGCHAVLIMANILIIVGGSFLASSWRYTGRAFESRLSNANVMRTTGQSMFLACSAMFLVAVLVTIRNETRSGRKLHRTLIILLTTSFPLIVRGIYGVVQSCVWELSYYNRANYRLTGFTPQFTAIEYCLGVVTEFVAALMLNFTRYTSRNEPVLGP